MTIINHKKSDFTELWENGPTVPLIDGFCIPGLIMVTPGRKNSLLLGRDLGPNQINRRNKNRSTERPRFKVWWGDDNIGALWSLFLVPDSTLGAFQRPFWSTLVISNAYQNQDIPSLSSLVFWGDLTFQCLSSSSSLLSFLHLWQCSCPFVLKPLCL